MNCCIRSVSILLVFSVPLLTKAQERTGQSGIIYGPGHAYSVTAPEGWILDNQIGRQWGLHAVFYHSSKTWDTALARMYVNTSAPDSGMTADPLARARADSIKFVHDNPGIRITVADTIRISDEIYAIVRHFAGDRYGNFEAVAYVAEKTITPQIVLTCQTEEAFNEALPAFKQLVRSYRWIGETVIVPPPFR